jgi:hypothetical protein
LHRDDPAPLKAGGHDVWIAAAENAEIPKLGAENALARDGGDRADYGFDFWEFGHLGNL